MIQRESTRPGIFGDVCILGDSRQAVWAGFRKFAGNTQIVVRWFHARIAAAMSARQMETS